MQKLLPTTITVKQPKNQNEANQAQMDMAKSFLDMCKRWNLLEVKPAQAGQINYQNPNHPVIELNIDNLSNIIINNLTKVTKETTNLYDAGTTIVNNINNFGFTGLKGDNTWVSTPLVAPNKYRVNHLRQGEYSETAPDLWAGPYFIQAAITSGGALLELEFWVDAARHIHITGYNAVAPADPGPRPPDVDPDYPDAPYILNTFAFTWSVLPITEFDFYNQDTLACIGDTADAAYNGTDILLTVTDIVSTSFQKLDDGVNIANAITYPLAGVGKIIFPTITINDKCVLYNSTIYVTGTVANSIIKKTTAVTTKIVNMTISSTASGVSDMVPFEIKCILKDNAAAEYTVFNTLTNHQVSVQLYFSWASDGAEARTPLTVDSVASLGGGESGILKDVTLSIPGTRSTDDLDISAICVPTGSNCAINIEDDMQLPVVVLTCWSDLFDQTSLNATKWAILGASANYTVVYSASGVNIKKTGTSTTGYYLVGQMDSFDDTFYQSIDFTGTYGAATGSEFERLCGMRIIIAGSHYFISAVKGEGTVLGPGDDVGIRVEGPSGELYAEVLALTSGKLEITRNGSDLVEFKLNGVTKHSLTKAGTVSSPRLGIVSATNTQNPFDGNINNYVIEAPIGTPYCS